MSLTLRCYSIAKRVISTYQPTNDAYAEYSIVFKESTDIMNPVLNIDTGGIYPTTNYCYIVELGLYYFINTIVSRTNTIFELHCECDVLATTKADILNTEAYVIYSTSNFNRWVRDDRVPLIIKNSEYVRSSSSILVNDSTLFITGSNETVLITTVSKNEGLVTWVTTETGVQSIINDLTAMGNTIWGSLTSQFGDAMKSIVQILRLPINTDCLDMTQAQVYLGDTALVDADSGSDVYMYKLNSKLITATGGISIPVTYTDFRYTEPYCTMKIALPFVGVVDFPISEMAPNGGLDWQLDIDLTTGSLVYTFTDPDNVYSTIASYSGQCGGFVPIASQQIANASNIFSSIATGVGTTALSLATANPTPAIVGGISSIASGFYNMNQKSTSILGSFSGGRSENSLRRINVVVEKFPTACEPSDLAEIEGRPLLTVTSLAELTGYVRTQNFQLAGTYIKAITDKVNSMLDSGIYIE